MSIKDAKNKVSGGFLMGIGIAVASIIVGIVWTKYIAPRLPAAAAQG